MSREKIPTIQGVYEVDEQLIRTSAAIMGDDSSFSLVLSIGDEYRKAGLTPIYYCNDNTTTLHVTTKEKMNGMLH